MNPQKMTIFTVSINARLARKGNPVYKLFRSTRCHGLRMNISGICPNNLSVVSGL
jgi:hypothetical protein